MEETRSLLEIAIDNMRGKKKPQNIYKFLDEVLSIKGISEDDEDYLDYKAQLYTDMIISAKFVFCGEDEWDLKERESLDMWDKDASYFNTDIEEEDDEDEITLDDYSLEDKDDEDEDEDEDEDTQDEDSQVDNDDDNRYDEEDEDEYDEDEYNDMMDDYEDLYDK